MMMKKLQDEDGGYCERQKGDKGEQYGGKLMKEGAGEDKEDRHH